MFIFLFKLISDVLNLKFFLHYIPVLQLISQHLPENFILRFMEGCVTATRLYQICLDVDIADHLMKVLELPTGRHAQHGSSYQYTLLLLGDEDVHIEDIGLGLEKQPGVCYATADRETGDGVSDSLDGVNDVLRSIAERLDCSEVESWEASLQGQTNHGSSHVRRGQGRPSIGIEPHS